MIATPRLPRTAARTIHVVVALLLGAMVYAPSPLADSLRPFMMVLGVPLATLSGLFLWQQGPIMRALGMTPPQRS